MTTPAIPLREGRPGWIIRLAALAVLVVAAGITAWLLAAQPWSSAKPGQDGPSTAAVRAFEEQTGIRVLRVAVTGQGGAGKAQVRAMVRRLAAAEPRGDHEADALAAAICHLSSAPLRGAIRRAR
jgi:hypothetical protein